MNTACHTPPAPFARLRGFLRRLPRRCWLLLGLPLSLLITLLAQHSPAFAEQVFALGVYRWLSQGISALTGLLPFSLLEVGIIALIILLIVLFFVFIRKLRREPARRKVLAGKAVLNLLCALSAVLLLFTLLCGVNYYRHPFSFYSGLTLQPATVEELDGLCHSLAEDANALRARLTTEDERGVTTVFTAGYQPVAQAAKQALDHLALQYPVLGGRYPAPKPVFFSRFMSRTEITGVYSPFTMEANVNMDATEYTIPATMCHELSHLRGFMREDEANFIAYLACREAEDTAFRYSGTMLALVYASNQLYAADPARYAALWATYSAGVARDLNADYDYWQQFEGTVISKVSNSVNDTYLKANRQSDGVKSYGRMVDLLLADYRQQAADA